MARSPSYSYSRLKCFDQCEYLYAERYAHWRAPFALSMEAFVGKMVHTVIEAHHKGRIETRKLALWEAFHEVWDRSFEAGISDTRKLGPDYWQQHGLKCLGHYLECGTAPATCNVLGLEARYKAALLSNPAANFQGILDRLIRTEDGDMVIDDFKTGNKQDRRWFLQDHQLPLYAHLVEGAFLLEPEEPIMTRRIYLATGEIEEFLVSRERRLEAWAWAQRTAIQAYQLELEAKAGANMATRISKLCDWCSLKRTCPAFAIEL